MPELPEVEAVARPRKTRRLHKAIVSVLRRALECCLHPAPDFRDAQWRFQGIEDILRVYDRDGKLCRRCGVLVRRIAQGGRSSILRALPEIDAARDKARSREFNSFKKT